ncbi:uncharacterized protein LOC126175345 [Schistocerca cancellata]|uniref:uncharacterized protein LOC126175345 n=1 Tax=Schistocerca cancellata TaxID=274614 RepID=UPI002119A1FA|nr:uncharacterized protein LOC126175345 [Schistocerca cancellata]
MPGARPSKQVTFAGVGAGSGSSEAARGAGGVSAGWRNAMQPEAGLVWPVLDSARVISDVAAALSGHAGHLQRRRIPDTSAALTRAAHLATQPGDAALRRIPGVRVQVFQTNGLVSFKTVHNPLQSGDNLEPIHHFVAKPSLRNVLSPKSRGPAKDHLMLTW